MSKSKTLFFTMMIISTIFTVSSNNWISMWMGLEMNMMAFMPLILSKYSKNSSMAAMMYFLVQSLGSLMLMFSMLMKIKIELFNELMTLSLLIKLGSAPFHMWIPEIMSKLSWNSCLMLSTWQKIAPLSMLMNMQNNMILMNITIIMSAMMGAIGGINQTSLRKIMGFSSINHIAWMMMSNSTNSWMMYITIYSFMMMTICYLFKYYNMMFINQMNNMNMSSSEKLCISISMLSMGGLPPFLGFLPKWMVIQNMINEKSFMVMTVMIMMSLITLMYYTRIMVKMMLLSASTQKWTMIKSKTSINVIITMTNLSLPLLVIMNFK
uniref:NADH-ubiquinone oxidoreductase chain 2 n=1 Tax=Anaxandra taurina TaxID=2575663 RepID=A0A4D6X7M5_9HEMI|nr:NADH dehydrogenase subunit 2 [Anaxandra taurina]QCI09235.1 NADH dehydrogenase subunit 2 [Anaxandra taurina]